MTVSAVAPDLATTAARLTTGGRGILAADESIATMSRRLAAAAIPVSATHRRDYRQLLLTAPGLSDTVSGVIWCDETFGQQLDDGRPFPDAARALGVLPGIKVDTGTVPLPGRPGSLVTEGLDGLGHRLGSYAARGAAFAKWRAVFAVDSINAWSARVNAQALARYAGLCQLHGIVPIVEPEVLATGTHDLVACANATRLALSTLVDELEQAGVDLGGVVLKPNFITPGLSCRQVSARTVAAVTVDVLRDVVPPTLPGIAFLSGGHPTERACAYLAEANAMPSTPWALTFSFGRALVSEALVAWGGDPAEVPRAQRILTDACGRAAAATR